MCQAVQLAAARRFCSEKGLEQLDIGCDDERGVPVFTCQAAAGGFIMGCSVGLAMVFNKHFVAQRFERIAKHIRRLLNDAGVGDGVDHAPLAMDLRVIQGKRQTGQGFAAARGHGKRKEAWRQRGLGLALLQNLGAVGIDFRSAGAGGQTLQVGCERQAHLIDGRKSFAPGWFAGVKVRLGVQKISIHKAGEDHANPQSKTCRATGNSPKVWIKVASFQHVKWRVFQFDIGKL